MSFFKNWNIKRYLLTYTLKSMPIVYILLLGIVLILLYPISFAENSSAWIGGYILAPILCAFVLKNILKDAAVTNRQWQALEQQGKLEEMLEDYRNSEKEIGGNIRVGQKYLFGKGSMRALAYSDISHIFMVNAERKGKVSGRTAFDAMRAGDEAAREVVDTYLSSLAVGIGNVVNIFQPEVISIGGGIANEKENLLTPLLPLIRREQYGEGIVPLPRVVIAELGNDAGIIGAAFLGIEL